MKRIILTALLGGLAMFVWMSVAHVVLPLGKIGFREIPNEAQVLEALHASMGETSGLYIYPGMGQGRADPTAYAKKVAANPSGLLVYHPPGSVALSPRQLATEFLAELIEAFLAIWLLAQTRLRSFGARLGFVVVTGILVSLGTNVSYWNFYGFPGDYTAVYMANQIVGFLCVGLVAAAMNEACPGRLAIPWFRWAPQRRLGVHLRIAHSVSKPPHTECYAVAYPLCLLLASKAN